MGVTELILLIFGGVVFTVSFFLPSGRKEDSDDAGQITEEQIKDIIDRELAEAKTQISDIVDETINYSMEKTERSMERLSNEKIMAVNEYSDSVLEQINRNHNEAVFLYDMLNDKHENLKNTVSEAVKTATEVKQAVKDAEVTAREAKEQALEVKQKIDETVKAKAEAKEFTPIMPEKIELTDESEKIFKDQEKTQVKIVSEHKTESTENAEENKKGSEAGSGRKESDKTDGKNNNERILELHEAGKSNIAIAKELGLGIGEVKLVIDLFEGI